MLPFSGLQFDVVDVLNIM